MRKTVLLVFALFIALLLLVHGCGGQREAVARARAAASHLRLQRDSLLETVAARDRERSALIRQRETHEAELTHLRVSAALLERRRAATQLSVRHIRTVGALLDRLRATFPELADSAWGFITVTFDDRDTLGLEYLTLPAWFAETFIIDHHNADSWLAQKDRLVVVDSLQLAVSALQDSVAFLAEANAEAYQSGYLAAYTGYQDLSRRYVAELQKPRISVPSLLGLVGAVGVGVVVGRVVR